MFAGPEKSGRESAREENDGRSRRIRRRPIEPRFVPFESRPPAVARALGLGRDLASDAGRTPEEKLARLRTAVAGHVWSRHLVTIPPD